MFVLRSLPKKLWCIACRIDDEDAVGTVRAEIPERAAKVECALFFTSFELAEHSMTQLQMEGRAVEMVEGLPEKLIECGLAYGCLDFVAGSKIGMFRLDHLAEVLEA